MESFYSTIFVEFSVSYKAFENIAFYALIKDHKISQIML